MMKLHVLVSFLIAATLSTHATAQRSERKWSKLSPFRGMRESPGGLEVQVRDDRWLELISLDRIESQSLISGAKRFAGSRWWKRITEDLVEVLASMGHRIDGSVDLTLRDPTTRAIIVLEAVEMTAANRMRLRDANRVRNDKNTRKRKPRTITRELALADLQSLRKLLDERFSYRLLRHIDIDELLESARRRLSAHTIRSNTLVLEADRILRAFGDGHSRVRNNPPIEPGFLPFLIDKANGGYVAFHTDRSTLLDDEHPFVIAIDGLPLQRWLESATKRANQGSPQWSARDALRLLRALNDRRGELDIKKTDTVEFTLQGPSGKVTRKLDVSTRWPIYGSWPQTSHTRMGDIGYLRISQMVSDESFLDSLDQMMHQFADTKGLIIDVRGNGGGSRDVLRRLFPYFLAPEDPPLVANVAAYRLPIEAGDAPQGNGYLHDRSLYPANWPDWSEGKAMAIEALHFKSEWQLPADQFSAWHYFVIGHADNPEAYPYLHPVIILLDGSCFSATDIFLGAFKGWHDVTLIGTPSGGSSGRAQRYILPNSGIRVSLASMASFRANGKLYEGRGIQPDLILEPKPRDFVHGHDSVLRAALEQLR